MKMNLLHDILKGLEAIEKREVAKQIEIPKSTRKGFGKLITATRGPAGEPISPDPYAVDYPQQTYDYDPESVIFLQVDRHSPEHCSKLNDLGIIGKYDPTTVQKILTLA